VIALKFQKLNEKLSGRGRKSRLNLVPIVEEFISMQPELQTVYVLDSKLASTTTLIKKSQNAFFVYQGQKLKIADYIVFPKVNSGENTKIALRKPLPQSTQKPQAKR